MTVHHGRCIFQLMAIFTLEDGQVVLVLKHDRQFLHFSYLFFNRQTNLDIFYVLHRIRSVLTRGSVCLRVHCLSKPSFPPIGRLPVRNLHFMLKFVQIVYFYSKFCNFDATSCKEVKMKQQGKFFPFAHVISWVCKSDIKI